MWILISQHKCFAKCYQRFCNFTAKSAGLHEASSQAKLLHQPVMVKEVIDNLNPCSGDVILDMTFGAGGHTRAILTKFKDCNVVALDRDPVAYEIAKGMSKDYNGRLTPLLGKFSELRKLLDENGISSLNGVLLDAGCSSMQMDTANRGFALAKDGPLDMRMDGDRYPAIPSAADVVNRLSVVHLAEILEKYGEEKHANKIARHIVRYRGLEGPITRTQQLANVIASAFDSKDAMRKDSLNRQSHIATKCFMAIRIFVNDELNELFTGLKTAENYIVPGGRLVAITFHSLEDRIVKRFLSGSDVKNRFGSTLSQKRKENVSNIPSEKSWIPLRKKVVVAQFDEIDDNARSRSAKLRSATRI